MKTEDPLALIPNENGEFVLTVEMLLKVVNHAASVERENCVKICEAIRKDSLALEHYIVGKCIDEIKKRNKS